MASKLKSIQKNLTLIVVVMVLVIAGLAFYLLKPQYDEIGQVKIEIEAGRSNLAARKQKLSNMKTLLANYQGVEEQLYNLSLSLPLKKDIPNLLVQLEALAVKSGVLMKSVSYEENIDEAKNKVAEVGPPADAEADVAAEEGALTFTTETEESETRQAGYSILNVELSLAAHYDSFIRYLEDVQRSFRFLDVTSIDFAIEDVSDSSGSRGEEKELLDFYDQTFEFSVKLKTYYLE